ncbi:MAG: type IX secretion system sortase PorU [Bacteroidia bacterium]|nr:type IX secretion system sortase PorU [Bacteroidia bacterium]
MYAQKAETTTLEWQESQTDQSGALRLHFRGAHYPAEYKSLPVYHKRLEFSVLNASILDPVYAPLSPQELPAVLEIADPEARLNLTTAYERKVASSLIYILPFRKNPANGQLEKLISFRLSYTRGEQPSAQKAAGSAGFASNSVLASGTWFKIGVTRDGIYKVDHEMLIEMGMDPAALSLQKIRLFGNGGGLLPLLNSSPRKDDLQECAIEVVDANNNGDFDKGDYFLFYGQGPDRWIYQTSEKQYIHQKNIFSDTTYYFLSSDLNGASKRIAAQPSLAPLGNEQAVTTFTDYAFHEEDQRNFIKSGRRWYGEIFDVVLNQKFNFSFPNLVPGPVKIKSSVAARTSTSFGSSSSFRVSHNNTTIFTHAVANVGVSYTDDFARTSLINGSFNAAASDFTIDYTFQPYNATATGWLDFIALNATRALSLQGNELFFRDLDTNNLGVNRRYTITNAKTNLRLWSLRDHNAVSNQQFSFSNGQIEFIQMLAPGEVTEYCLFSENAFRTPFLFGRIANQDLHGSPAAEYLIITHENFLPEAERLAAFHRDQDNLSSIVVSSRQVFNEFSSGAQDVAAIRDFVRMFYERASSAAELPKYVLLIGDGSYDPKYRIGGNTNYIPCFQSDNSVSLLVSYTSDDFFGLLDANEGTLNGPELMDAGVGRLPVRTLEEAREMVDKIITYSTAGTITDQTFCAGTNSTRLGDWRNMLCFVSDDQDRNLHQRQSERIAAIVQQNQPVYNIDKINSDAYQQISTPGGQRYPDVNDAISKRVEKGALLMNYTGHGGELGWAAESILNNDMINSWRNLNNMPAFVTATCEFSRYDDPQRTSAGEFVLLNESGGGICLFTTVRLTFAIDNELINTDMMHHFFTPINGLMPRTGDIQRLSKRDNPSNRNVTLLGDPALLLAYPKYKVQTVSIEESGSGVALDTMSALSRVTVKGKVTDASGSTLSGFNGVVYPTIYDKSSKIYNVVNDVTGNDISIPDSFNLRKNILYKGKASVKNGEFSCSFIVPKDISFQYGTGRLSYYAHNGEEDAQGYNESFYIGGSSNNALQDQAGPQIRLFMNDENFIYGSMTNAAPSIYAILFDSSGINTVGNGIGHDITAQIDGKPQQLYVLNDYYESDLDSYQKGRVLFPLDELAEGLHTVTFKAWDINNNSSEATTEFVVSSSAGLALNRVLNYPNPFTTKTQFMFEHNRPCTGMAIQVQIYTVSGKLVKTIDAYQVCEGFRNTAVEWDGKDDFGDQLARGVYLYRLRIRTAEGETAQKMERLVLLR